jgi:diadenylate cyclase
MRIQDVADILIMTILVYQLYFWFRKTRALQVVLGLGSLVLLYIITKNLGLFMTNWVLQELGTVIFIVIVVVFQGEIRQALYRFSLLRNFFDRDDETFSLDIPGIVSTVFALAERRTGAIIVFERKERLDDYLLHGVALDCLVSSQLLASIFEDRAPLHDGAVIIRNSRISEASSHLPLSQSTELPQYLGTRHRAALGLTEKTDALVLIVSEERGEVSYASAGELVTLKSRDELTALLETSVITAKASLPNFSLKDRLVKNLLPKLVTLVIVIVCWLLINARQGGVQSVTAQVKFHGLPESLALKNDLPSELDVQLKVLSTIFISAKKLEIAADIDLSTIHEGVNSITVEGDSFQLPLGVSVVKVAPAVIKMTAEKKIYRDLPVSLKKTGRLPKGVRLKSVIMEPAKVRVLGPESSVAQLVQLYTEPLDLDTIARNQIVRLKLISPSPQVKLSSDESVSARLVVSK